MPQAYEHSSCRTSGSLRMSRCLTLLTQCRRATCYGTRRPTTVDTLRCETGSQQPRPRRPHHQTLPHRRTSFCLARLSCVLLSKICVPLATWLVFHPVPPFFFSAVRFHCSLSRRLLWSLDSVPFLPKLDGMHVGNCIFHVCPSYALWAIMSGQIRISVLGLCRPSRAQSLRAIACFSLRTSYVSFVFNDHGSRSIGGDASATSVSGWRLHQSWHWRCRRLRWRPAPAQLSARV